jgi:hypothetical protein
MAGEDAMALSRRYMELKTVFQARVPFEGQFLAIL